MLSFGPEGERSLGARAYRALLAMFIDNELIAVKHCMAELGRIHPLSFERKPDQPLIPVRGGRCWQVTFIDWSRKVAIVQPPSNEARAAGKGPPHRSARSSAAPSAPWLPAPTQERR